MIFLLLGLLGTAFFNDSYASGLVGLFGTAFGMIVMLLGLFGTAFFNDSAFLAGPP